MYGYMGQMLHINLSTGEIDTIPTEPYARQFLGGRGIASAIYREKVAPEITAFDPENILVFASGPLVATGTQATSRLAVVGKSPMVVPEGFCYGNIGGFVGAELKRAGFDAVIIEGKAASPVYLWIHDDKAELLNAAPLWGLGVYRVEELLKKTHGKDIKYIATGPAGDNLVRTAVVVASYDSTSTAGYGAVMGSKNLKAIAIKGSKMPAVADPAALKKLNRYSAHIGKRYRWPVPPMMRSTKHEYVTEYIGKGSCYQCGMDCIRGRYRIATGREAVRKCQSMEAYMPWLFGREDEPVDTFFDTPTLCNDYSICTIEIRYITQWLYLCYGAGYLTEQETGLPLSKMGTREFLEKLLHMIAYREGFGDILAEGLPRASWLVGEKARLMIPVTLVAVGIGDATLARAYKAHAVLTAMEPRVHMPILHEVAFLMTRWRDNQVTPDLSQVTTKVFQDVARAFWGSEEAADLSSYEGKATAAKKTQDRTYLKDSLGLCDFAWPIMDSLNTADYVGDPTLIERIVTAVTGIDSDELQRCAERIVTLQRAILVREGWTVPDTLAEYHFTEPMGTDSPEREQFVPQWEGRPTESQGSILDREKFKALMQEYYMLRGWDPDTGLPYRETLESLDVAYLVPDFEHAGYSLTGIPPKA
jgi:aldehyde:ferredoxin oxidoreductase